MRYRSVTVFLVLITQSICLKSVSSVYGRKLCSRCLKSDQLQGLLLTGLLTHPVPFFTSPPRPFILFFCLFLRSVEKLNHLPPYVHSFRPVLLSCQKRIIQKLKKHKTLCNCTSTSYFYHIILMNTHTFSVSFSSFLLPPLTTTTHTHTHKYAPHIVLLKYFDIEERHTPNHTVTSET
jgi:hypothetical protein